MFRSFERLKLLSTLKFNRFFCKKTFKFPEEPIKIAVDQSKLPPETKITKKTIQQLERLSLVDFGTEEGIKVVEDGIRFADQMFLVDTNNVEPMYTVLENESCHLREDEPESDVTRAELLSHAAVTEEEYYVAPVGNVELVPLDGEDLRNKHKDDLHKKNE